MVMIDVPARRRRTRRITAGAAIHEGGVAILGIEVTQAIQNLAHGVRLIAGKPTVVRVYLEPRGLASNARVDGEIVVSASPSTPGSFISSRNGVRLQASDHPDLAAQRRDAALSLNFVLPNPPTGPMTVRLKRVVAVSPPSTDVPLLPGNQEVSVQFAAGPELRVRCLGLRYSDPRSIPPRDFAPAATHFDHLRSFLTRAYPVSAVEWTQSVVAAPSDFVPPFSAPLPNGRDPLWAALLGIVHQHMMMLRQADMDAGWDPRTHYYGLVSDDSGFFRGAANDVPTTPTPGTVAVGPCGIPSASFSSWDKDGSYGDWYGAHELSHTFGRFHPGFCQGQGNNDPAFPYPAGRISDAAQDLIGFDVGDASLSVPLRAYPHEAWHDVMTYCDNQWLSKYTYDGIYDRLVAEDALFAPPVA